MKEEYEWINTPNGEKLIEWMKEYKKKLYDMPEGDSSSAGMGKAIAKTVKNKAETHNIPPDEATNYFFKLLSKDN